MACHLVMAGRLIDDDPKLAYAHADAARRRLPRVAGVREAMGLCAYACEEWAEALSELRAARRMSGSNEHLAVMADCERGLGRPDRALALAASPEAKTLDQETAIEMRLVVAGARRDLGQLDSAVVSLQGPDLDATKRDPWSVRLFYAYADALLAAGRTDEARTWFVNTAVADLEGETDAADRIDSIDGVEIGDIVELEQPDGADAAVIIDATPDPPVDLAADLDEDLAQGLDLKVTVVPLLDGAPTSGDELAAQGEDGVVALADEVTDPAAAAASEVTGPVGAPVLFLAVEEPVVEVATPPANRPEIQLSLLFEAAPD